MAWGRPALVPGADAGTFAVSFFVSAWRGAGATGLTGDPPPKGGFGASGAIDAPGKIVGGLGAAGETAGAGGAEGGTGRVSVGATGGTPMPALDGGFGMDGIAGTEGGFGMDVSGGTEGGVIVEGGFEMDVAGGTEGGVIVEGGFGMDVTEAIDDGTDGGVGAAVIGGGGIEGGLGIAGGGGVRPDGAGGRRPKGAAGAEPPATGIGLAGRLIIAVSRGVEATGRPSRRAGRTILTVSFFGSAILIRSKLRGIFCGGR